MFSVSSFQAHYWGEEICHVLVQSCHRRVLTPEVSGCAIGDASPRTCIPRPPSPQRGARPKPRVERSGTQGHLHPMTPRPDGAQLHTPPYRHYAGGVEADSPGSRSAPRVCQIAHPNPGGVAGPHPRIPTLQRHQPRAWARKRGERNTQRLAARNERRRKNQPFACPRLLRVFASTNELRTGSLIPSHIAEGRVPSPGACTEDRQFIAAKHPFRRGSVLRVDP
jgi:hypothetical protein